jgi:hypothetical protein
MWPKGVISARGVEIEVVYAPKMVAIIWLSEIYCRSEGKVLRIFACNGLLVLVGIVTCR